MGGVSRKLALAGAIAAVAVPTADAAAPPNANDDGPYSVEVGRQTFLPVLANDTGSHIRIDGLAVFLPTDQVEVDMRGTSESTDDQVSFTASETGGCHGFAYSIADPSGAGDFAVVAPDVHAAPPGPGGTRKAGISTVSVCGEQRDFKTPKYVNQPPPGGCTVIGSVGDDSIDLGADHATVCTYGGADSVDGSPDRDMLFGGANADILMGGGGPDVVNGESGRDDLYGGVGADTLAGGANPDRLFGGANADLLRGGTGRDDLHGGGGADTLKARDGHGGDLVDGGPGHDTCRADSGDQVTHCEA